MSFVERMVGDVAWPLVVLIIFLLLRRPITRLIPSLHSLKWRDVEATFQKSVREAEEVAQTLSPQPLQAGAAFPQPEVITTPDWFFKAQAVAETSPAGAVLEAWLEVENEIRRLGRPYGRGSVMRMVSTLADAGVVPRRLWSVIADLAALRNQVVHGDVQVTTGSALSFVDAARSVALALSQIEGQQEGAHRQPDLWQSGDDEPPRQPLEP